MSNKNFHKNEQKYPKSLILTSGRKKMYKISFQCPLKLGPCGSQNHS